jgi:hypothetical protein
MRPLRVAVCRTVNLRDPAVEFGDDAGLHVEPGVDVSP